MIFKGWKVKIIWGIGNGKKGIVNQSLYILNQKAQNDKSLSYKTPLLPPQGDNLFSLKTKRNLIITNQIFILEFQENLCGC
jgi:hypothetical protein